MGTINEYYRQSNFNLANIFRIICFVNILVNFIIQQDQSLGQGNQGRRAIPYFEFARVSQIHRQRFPPETITNHFYVIIPIEQVSVLNFVVASTSRQRLLNKSRLPVITVKNGYALAYLSLEDKKWTYKTWTTVLKDYPYSIGRVPLIIRGDWLIDTLTDTTESQAYYFLLYGKRPTKKEFLTFWGVNPSKKSSVFGFIEGDSQVSVNKKRLIESLPVNRGNYAFSTKDSLMKDNVEDPLENLNDTEFKHDGEEWIIGHNKFDSSSGEWVNLQYYALFNGTGGLVDKADTDLVEDYSRFKGLAAIRTPGSCINCHVQGLNIPTRNEYRNYILSGAKVYAVKDTQEFIDIFYGSNLGKEIKRANEDYSGAVTYFHSRGTDSFNRLYKSTINEYWQEIGLDRAASELYTNKEELKLAIAYKRQVPANAAKLAHGLKLTRKQFRNNWKLLYVYLKEWQKANE